MSSLKLISYFSKFISRRYVCTVANIPSRRDCADSKEDLDWLLDQGVDVSLTDPHRQDNGFNLGGGERDHSLKVLNNIAKNGDIELSDHIVSRGADPLRSMSLHAVSRCRDVDKMAAMIDHLLDHYHMDIEANNEDLRDFFGAVPDSGSPLMCAIFHENVAAVRKLLDRGAELKWSVKQAIGDCMYGGFLPALGPLLDGGADVDQAFRYAVSRNNVDAAKMCLERGVNPTHILEKWQRMIRRRGRRAYEISDSESDGEDDQAEAEEAGGEQEEENEEDDTESRQMMRIFLNAIRNDLPSRA
jgi:hypothetical protein